MTMNQRLLSFVGLLALATAAFAQPTLSGLPSDGLQFRFRSASSSVSAGAGGSWDISIVMEDDNENSGLGSSFRRWWHCQIDNINSSGDTLNVTISNAGYSDVILPVWAESTDGTNFGDYERLPLSAVPSVSGGGTVHDFTVTTNPGVVAIRLAKYFPYTPPMFDAYRATINTHPYVTESVIGMSAQGRNIYMYEITDSTSILPKHRVWVHTAVHCAETTAYFTTEGLIDWLLSGAGSAESLLDETIFDIVLMANPDGVALGNYRTTSTSVNLENFWGSPYNSTVPEIVAMRTQIESYMGTVATPGANPIEIVLNLHSSHGLSYPFHFRHNANASWPSGSTGVIPAVNAIEGTWIGLFEGRSAFMDLGTTQSSTAGAPTRPFVESMMHDRWSSDPGWTEPLVMAITMEGTYGLGPDASTWNTQDDYRLLGKEMGFTIADYFGVAVPVDLGYFKLD